MYEDLVGNRTFSMGFWVDVVVVVEVCTEFEGLKVHEGLKFLKVSGQVYEGQCLPFQKFNYISCMVDGENIVRIEWCGV